MQGENLTTDDVYPYNWRSHPCSEELELTETRRDKEEQRKK